ncbi:MAG TPA: hypothetical protein VGR53_00500 [Nitrososphaerales archaeon]|nr:hypothetical protein [Nitrososphaerales archaeon]
MIADSGMVEADFSVLREDYSRYLVEDGTMLRVKIVVRKILKTPAKNPQGYPLSMGVDSVNVVSAQVPDRLKRKPSSERFDITREVGKESKFELMGDQRDQEYITSDGFRILMKPVVTKVFKYDKFNEFGEPIYNVTVQAITNIEKVSAT